MTPFDPPPLECRWKIVDRSEGYEISEFGHVRRRIDGGKSAGKLIRPRLHARGYVQYHLSAHGKYTYHLAHRLVLEAFAGEAEPGLQGAHWDGDPLNNHISNLRWATAAENAMDKDRHGRMLRGDKHPSRLRPETRPRGEKVVWSKLREDDVRAIRSSRLTNPELALQYGVHRALILRIRNGKIWRHVT